MGGCLPGGIQTILLRGYGYCSGIHTANTHVLTLLDPTYTLMGTILIVVCRCLYLALSVYQDNQKC